MDYPTMNTYDPETHLPKQGFNDNDNDTVIYTKCGTIAIVISGLYFIVAVLLWVYLDSETLPLFEYVPTFIPAITYLVCGLSTIVCAWKPFRNVILLNVTSLLAIANAVLSSVIAMAVIFINFNTFNAINHETCAMNGEDTQCQCSINAYSPAFPIDKIATFTTSQCITAIWVLKGCLVVTTLASIVAVFLSIFMCRLIDELAD